MNIFRSGPVTDNQSYVKKFTLAERKEESSRVKSKYPDRVPVIVEKARESDVPNIDKTKYLVPADLTMGQFMYVIRKRIKLAPDVGLYFFVGNNISSSATLLGEVYENKKDKDGFLYVCYSGENTYGM